VSISENERIAKVLYLVRAAFPKMPSGSVLALRWYKIKAFMDLDRLLAFLAKAQIYPNLENS
jgi:hypothetical protein